MSSSSLEDVWEEVTRSNPQIKTWIKICGHPHGSIAVILG